MSALEVVILDIDGTVVDSNDFHARAWVDALAEHGIQASFEKVRTLIGMGGDKILPEVAGFGEDEPRGEAISQRRSEIFRECYLPRVRAFPAVRPLMERIRALGIRLVVATSARKEEVEPLLRIAGIDDLIDKKTSSDDADRSKPDPDIVVAAVQRAQIAPEHAIMLGDTPYDVAAARRAKVEVIAFRCGGWDDASLKGAMATYKDPGELLARFDKSPIAQRAASAKER